MCKTSQQPLPADASFASMPDICDCVECQKESLRMVRMGDIVKIDLTMTPMDGLVPEPLFDRNGIITFVVGWGNYLPALHELVKGMKVNDTVENVSIDAGWGERNPDLVMSLPKSKLKRFLQDDGSLPTVGSTLRLQGGIQLLVLEANEETETCIVDANPPLAGASYNCSLRVLELHHLPAAAVKHNVEQQQQLAQTKYSVATFALGCFWGGELAYMRVDGVVGTRVGYTQGTVNNPTYEAVCTGETQHREAIMVIYDPEVVSYHQLVEVALNRLAATNTGNNNNSNSNMFGDMFAEEGDEETSSQQYRHGFYYHSEEQRSVAEQVLSVSNLYDVEVRKAAAFYDAEPYHQQYLLKGGQSARKGAKETIRCYG